MTLIGVAVKREGLGHSAFGIDEHGGLHRLSPSWLRDTTEERLTTFEINLKEKGKKAKIQRMARHTTGKHVVVGESLPIATQRAVKALKMLAMGQRVDVPETKEGTK